jgi:hypothetical protein
MKKYLIRKPNWEGQVTGKAHVWIEDMNDTACRMWSSGGINRKQRYEVSDDHGKLPICHMCDGIAL